jgi:hypothetical protein
VEVVDSSAFQAEVEYYLGDCHHLNREGHAKLALLLAPAIQTALHLR